MSHSLSSIIAELRKGRHFGRAGVLLDVQGEIICLKNRVNQDQEKLMLVAAELKNLRKQVTDLSAENAALKAAAPPADHLMDEADVAEVKAEQAAQNLDANGQPNAVAVPPVTPAP